MRFSSMDEMIALRERVRNVVGTCSIPDILLGSPDAAASKKAVSDSSSAPAPAAASALPSLKEHEVSTIDQSNVQVISGDQIRSREKRAKKRNRDRQSSSSIDEEKKEDSVFGDDTFDASEEKELNVRGRQKRSKSESSEESLYDPASDAAGVLKVDEDAMELGEGIKPRRLRAIRKRSRNDEDVDIGNDKAIAELMQESEYAAGRNRVAKSARKASAMKLEDEDESDGRKIIDVEDGNSATLHRAIGSRHADEETGMSPSPRKKKKTARSKKDNMGDASDGDWVCHLCSTSNDSERKRCTECRGWKGGKRPLYAGSPEASIKRDKKQSSISTGKKKSSAPKKSSPSRKSSSPSKSKSKSTTRHDKAERSCSVLRCNESSGGPRRNYFCKKHYENSQVMESERRSKRLCSVAGCPRVDDGARSNFMCVSHFRKSNKETEDALNADESGDDDNDEDIDEALEENQSNVSDGSQDEEDANPDRAEPIEDGPESKAVDDAANIEEEEEEDTKPTASSETSDADVSLTSRCWSVG